MKNKTKRHKTYKLHHKTSETKKQQKILVIGAKRAGDRHQTLKHSNTQTLKHSNPQTKVAVPCHFDLSVTVTHLILTNQHAQLRRPRTRHPHGEEATGEDRWYPVFREACPCCRCPAGEDGAPCVGTGSGGEEGWQEATLSAITCPKSEVLVLLDFWLSVALQRRNFPSES